MGIEPMISRLRGERFTTKLKGLLNCFYIHFSDPAVVDIFPNNPKRQKNLGNKIKLPRTFRDFSFIFIKALYHQVKGLFTIASHQFSNTVVLEHFAIKPEFLLSSSLEW